MKNRIICLLLSIAMIFGSLGVLASCGDDTVEACTEHTDADGDKKCDVCGESTACTVHVDADHNLKCDKCDEAVACTNHLDKSPKDGKCDYCGVDVAHTCVDGTGGTAKDAKCDICGKDVACRSCTDADHNLKCDVCGKDVECTAHVDAEPKDGKCDYCQSAVEHTCIDADHNLKCDICAAPVACTAHADTNPRDGKCDYCTTKVECTLECEDNDGNGKCDYCGGVVESDECVNHVDDDMNGVCDECGAIIEDAECEQHMDEGRDGSCDVCGEACEIEECAAGAHVDGNDNDLCDICGASTAIVCDKHVDENPKDASCDVCGKFVACEECVDNDNNKICDICGEEVITVCVHEDFNFDGLCDWCNEVMQVACNHADKNGDGKCDYCGEDYSEEDEVVSYPWENTQTLIFQMTNNTNGDELPSACERYLAGGSDQNTWSESIDEMVIQRNAMAEYVTNVTLTYEYYPNTAEYKWGNNIDRIETTVKSGSTKDTPDMYCNFVYDMVGASLKGCFANLYSTARGQGELAGKNYFEFLDDNYDETVDNKGYMFEYMTSLTLSQHKMYVLASDYFTDMIRAFFIIPVSVKLIEDVGMEVTGDRNNDGEFTLDDFYEQVKAGEWTYDLLAQYSEKVYQRAGDNQGAAWLGDEVVGFAMAKGGVAATGLMYTTSVVIIHKEWNDERNDWDYYYPADNPDLYAFCDATSALFKKPGIIRVNGNNETQWGASHLLAIRTRFAENHVLFGDIMMVGALEFEQYQTMKENGGFGVVPVPLYRTGSADKYLTQIHNVGRPGAIATNTTKFAECTAFLNYQSTHSADILNEYYDYKLQYDVADGSKGTVYMLQYIRNNVRTSFDKAFEDAIGVFYGDEAYDSKWLVIISGADFQIDIRGSYTAIYEAKEENLKTLVSYFDELPN